MGGREAKALNGIAPRPQARNPLQALHNVILDMSTYFDSLEKKEGVIQSARYAVEWKFSFEE